MFKVSKRPYRCAWHDEIIFRWCHNPPELNNPGWKLKICATLIAILRYLEAKFDYGYFIIFLRYGSTILHKKIQVISSKNEGMTTIFPIQIQIENRENHRHAFNFASNDLKFLCRIVEP